MSTIETEPVARDGTDRGQLVPGRGWVGRPTGRPPSMGESASESVHGYNYGETANINRGS